MSKKLMLAAMAASLAMTAAPQAVNDAEGVAVNTNGAQLMHRGSVAYPPEAMAKGIQGTVTAEVKLDANGEVSDASILSGPDELRRTVLQSVLGWHFMKTEAGTRTVTVTFARPENGPVAATPAVGTMPGTLLSTPRTIRNISVEGLSSQAREELMAVLPVHVGEQTGAETSAKLAAAVRGFDEHLKVATLINPDGSVALRIMLPAVAAAAPGGQTIRVGGNVQAANLVSQVAPVYPAEAKAARIQGAVELNAIIGPDGTVQSLQVASGDPALVKSALDAVKQWVYKPTLLNGAPVTVSTSITVNYTLSK